MNMKINSNLTLCFLVALSAPAFGDERSTGNYNVPVEECELVNSSDYTTNYRYNLEDGKVTRMKYTLPLELTGVENRVSITETPEEGFPWSGANARGSCQQVEGKFSCDLIYDAEDLVFDIEKTEEVIRTKFAGNALEIDRRLEVAERFRSEPRGTTSFPIESASEE